MKSFSIRTGLLAAAVALLSGPAIAKDKLTFQTSWTAQAEHGGFYQAIADGTYDAANLEVVLKPGGPQLNAAQLLIGGAADIAIISGSAIALNMVQQNVPFVAIAAIFQKDPRIIMAHPEAQIKTVADLKGRAILVSADGRQSYWKFLKVKYGFSDEQMRPYTFNLAPFMADKTLIQQGYVTSEPFSLRNAGFNPTVLLLADHGYDPYSSLLMVSSKMATEKAELVQRFIDASLKGWYSFLHSSNAGAMALIKKDNPAYPEGQGEFTTAELKRFGIVESGDTEKLGIGAMTDERWKSFFDLMVTAGDYPADLNYKAAYTTKFVNKRVGM